MIIEEQDKIINNSNLSSKSFDVEENAVLFWVMSNALYTYKERAVLRELAANGWDAHKALGKENIPVKIKLPTAMEPELVFQDFGCGMNRQDLENYYFAYFKSTKRASNDSIGGFGVGCKTPFILSQTYSIETVKDGVKNVALAVLDNGIPQAIYVSEEPTDEPSGTIIRIPVSDEVVIRQLNDEAYKLFINWPVQPTITKGLSGEFNILKNHYKSFNKDIYLSNNGYFSKTDFKGYFNNVTIGMFEYTLPSTLKTKVVDKLIHNNTTGNTFSIKLRNIYTLLNGASINFNIGIGDIKLSPSRESIEDVTENVETIAKYLVIATDQILKEVMDNSSKILDSLNDLFSKSMLSLKDFSDAKDALYKVYSPELITLVSTYLHSTIKDIEEPNKTKILDLIKHDYVKKVACSLDNVGNVNYCNINNLLEESYFLNHSLYSHINSTPSFYEIDKGKIFRSSKEYRPYKLLELNNKAKGGNTTFYLINDMPSLAIRYMNAMDVDHIEIDGVKIQYDQILGVPDKNVYDLVKKVFKGYFEELDISSIVLPKVSKKVSASKTKKDDIPAFTVYADSTGQLEQRVYNVGEWYDLTFNDDVNFIVFGNDRNDSPAPHWLNLFKTVPKLDKPYIFLGVVKNSELTTKRYMTFIQGRKVTEMGNYHIIPQELQTLALKCSYSPYIDTLHKFFAAKKTLEISSYYTIKDEKGSTVKSTYIKYRKNNILAIVKDLMGIQEYKKFIRMFIETNNYDKERMENGHHLHDFYYLLTRGYGEVVPGVTEETFYSVLHPSKNTMKSKRFNYKKIPQMHLWRMVLNNCYGNNEVDSLLWLYKSDSEIRDDLHSIYNNLLK